MGTETNRIIHWSDIPDLVDRAQALLTWDEEAWESQCERDEYYTELLEMSGDYRHLDGDYAGIIELEEKLNGNTRKN